MAIPESCVWCGEDILQNRFHPYCSSLCRSQHEERKRRAATPPDPYALVKRVLLQLAADDGFVVWSEVRAELSKHGVVNPDKLIYELEQAGKLRLKEFDYGQSRHGIGLNTDQRKQLCKFELT